jgi:hypothetical protein
VDAAAAVGGNWLRFIREQLRQRAGLTFMAGHFASDLLRFRPAAAHRCRAGAGFLAAAILLLCGCAAQPTSFATPEEAVDSLVAALRADDESELHRVLGPDSDELLWSGDEVADARGRAEFLRLYDEKHQLKPEADDWRILEVGSTDWPLPVPVVQGEQGWYFDTAAGLDEVLSRRIGRNELSTIQVCLAIIEAQREYAAADFAGEGWGEYARKVNSDPGKRNGLYWPVAPGETESPLGELVAQATAEGYEVADFVNPPQPYHGYFYRILTGQGPAAHGGAMNFVVQDHMIGGFGIVAWPAEYGNSGLKTFIASHHGAVYERDLGEDTDRIARTMQAFNPEPGWELSDTTEVFPEMTD